MSALDEQVGGNHYKNRGIQPVVFIGVNRWDFFQGNILKYLTRHEEKNGAQDVEKCPHYVRLREEVLERDRKTLAEFPFLQRLGWHTANWLLRLADRATRTYSVGPHTGAISMVQYMEANSINNTHQRRALEALEGYVYGTVSPEDLIRELAGYHSHVLLQERRQKRVLAETEKHRAKIAERMGGLHGDLGWGDGPVDVGH